MRAFKRFCALVALVTVVSLTGCASPATTTNADPAAVACNKVAGELQAAQADATRLAGTPGEQAAKDRAAALKQRMDACAATSAASPTATATPSVSPSATPTATPSTTPSATPTATQSDFLSPTDYVGWDQVVTWPPAGLQASIDDHKALLGYSWSDVQKWAKIKVNGKVADARVILVFGQDLTVNAAQQAANIKADVPVVKVVACKAITGTCPSTGVSVVLAPLGPNGSPDIVRKGVVGRESGYPLYVVLEGEVK